MTVTVKSTTIKDSIKVTKDFVITNNHLDNEKVSKDTLLRYKNLDGFTTYFKLYDDDDNLYYSGYIHKDIKDEFIPLDWAMYDSGCTYMEIRNSKTGKMEML